MIDQEKQSSQAATEGCCHTASECEQMYTELSPEIKAPALKMLAEELANLKAETETMYKADPKGWYAPYHFGWGMAVRNLLRSKGFGEAYFKVHNLDDIYIELVEEAFGLS